MEPIIALNPDAIQQVPVKAEGNDAEVEGFSECFDDISHKVTQLEQKLNEVEQFYTAMDGPQPNTSKSSSIMKDKVKEKHNSTVEKQQHDASNSEEAALRRTQELKRQFATIFHQAIEKPMDFSTITNKMDGKDGIGYKNVREIYADVRLVFKNAMKYNDKRHDVYVMAKSLLENFEGKWLLLLPEVVEEEKRQEEEEAKAQLDMQLSQEAVHANMARDISSELSEVDIQLEKLRKMVVQKCRKMTTEEKKKIGAALTRLSSEDLNKALKIVAENNPSFQATAEEVNINMDAQSELTLWRLKVFVQESLKVAGRSCGDMGGYNDENNDSNENNKKNNKNNAKRRREICDTLTKTAVKRSKKRRPNT